MDIKAQKEQILAYLKEGHRLTPLDALFKFRCERLAARIWDLKKAGHPIIAEMVEVGPDKKRVASYRMAIVEQLKLPL